MKNLTDFGREVRKLRIENCDDVARNGSRARRCAGIPCRASRPVASTSEISSFRNVIELFGRRGLDAQHLMDAAARSRKEVRIRFEEAREDQVELAVALARRFQDLSPAQVARVMHTVTEDTNG